ncbi:MAG: hypothetical protein KF691_02745 [Phycisphaeraceae bacterium]|nr:hypothetical protein [Phycisphaeraceae bacterium]
MNRPLSALNRASSFAGGFALALASSAVAQVSTADLSERPRPPIPKAAEQLMTGHGVLMILIGVILIGLVVGTCLIPAKRGHLD